MNEHPNAALVRSAYEAVEREDMETFAAALHDTLGGRHQASRYVDVDRLRDGKAMEHWHLALDQNTEAELFAG